MDFFSLLDFSYDIHVYQSNQEKRQEISSTNI